MSNLVLQTETACPSIQTINLQAIITQWSNWNAKEHDDSVINILIETLPDHQQLNQRTTLRNMLTYFNKLHKPCIYYTHKNLPRVLLPNIYAEIEFLTSSMTA